MLTLLINLDFEEVLIILFEVINSEESPNKESPISPINEKSPSHKISLL